MTSTVCDTIKYELCKLLLRVQTWKKYWAIRRH